MAQGALVTGGAYRVGQAICRGLAARGLRLAIHYCQSGDGAAALAKEINDAGGHAVTVAADFTDAQECEALIEAAASAIGPLGLLVNNASSYEEDDVGTITAAGWDRQLAINLRAPMLLSRDFAAALPAGQPGNIINLLDQRVWRPTPEFTSYTLSKSALWALTQTLALALAPKIRVNGIGPGPLLANQYQRAEDFAAEQRGTLLGRGPQLTEIVAGIDFILDSPSLTGQMIALDGGQHLQ